MRFPRKSRNKIGDEDVLSKFRGIRLACTLLRQEEMISASDGITYLYMCSFCVNSSFNVRKIVTFCLPRWTTVPKIPSLLLCIPKQKGTVVLVCIEMCFHKLDSNLLDFPGFSISEKLRRNRIYYFYSRLRPNI